MKSKNKQTLERLERFKALYSAAKAAAEGKHAELQSYMKQYLGSSAIDGSSESAEYVRNITFEIIESEIDPNVPSPKADTYATDERHIKNASAVEKLCRKVRTFPLILFLLEEPSASGSHALGAELRSLATEAGLRARGRT